VRLSCAVLALVGCSPGMVTADADVCAPMRSAAVGSAGFAPYGHSHNDYEQTRPLADALAAKFYSVEADCWLRNGDILLSHDGVAFKGKLKDVYLDPLQARVDAMGSVYGDGVQFQLWIELKDGSAEMRTALAALLEPYSMLTVFTDGSVTAKPVTAVLTGNDQSKKAYVDERTTRKATRDRGSYDVSDAPADNKSSWYGIRWGTYMTWDGTMTIPDSERTRLGCLVGDIHRKGAKVRFWANPETTAYRQVAIDTGIDLIGTDELPGLHDFLAGVQ
jgi:hypothetical protein